MVHVLAQVLQQPRAKHWNAAIIVVRYLKGCPGQGVLLTTQSDLQISAITTPIGLHFLACIRCSLTDHVVLQHLLMSLNFLKGEIQTSLFNCSRVQFFSNSLEQVFPSELGSLMKLAFRTW